MQKWSHLDQKRIKTIGKTSKNTILALCRKTMSQWMDPHSHRDSRIALQGNASNPNVKTSEPSVSLADGVALQ